MTATGIPLTGGTQKVTRTLTTPHNGWNPDGRYNIISLSTSIAQTPKKIVNEVPSYWVSASPNPKSKFFADFTNLKLHSSGDLYATYPWNGYSYSDPYTDTAARNGICRMPSNNTSAIDPIEISGTSPASSSTGLTVDLLVK